MKYYILRDEELIPVSQREYEKWENEEMKYALPSDLKIRTNEHIYEIECHFSGKFDEKEKEDFEPFTLLYSMIGLKLTKTKIKEVAEMSDWEQFSTEKEMQERRNELIKYFKNDKFPSYEDEDDDEDGDDEDDF